MNDSHIKSIGCLLGFIVGDALGSPLEFSDRDTFGIITEMESNYLYNLSPGHWTEKTSIMLCVLNNLIDKGDFTYEDYLGKYHHFIVSGECLMNGTATSRSIEISNYIKTTGIKIGQFLKYRQKLPLVINPYDHHQIDCEPLFRIAPIVLKYYKTPSICIKYVEIMTKLTHISPVCVDACRWYASLIMGGLMGVSKNVVLSDKFNIMDITTYDHDKIKIDQSYINGCIDTMTIFDKGIIKCKSNGENTFIRTLYPSILKIQRGCYKKKTRDMIISDQNITNCLEGALWALYNTTNFEDGCVYAVNLGLNSSSIGAIYGQLAGIYYQIPSRWSSKIDQWELIEQSINTIF